MTIDAPLLRLGAMLEFRLWSVNYELCLCDGFRPYIWTPFYMPERLGECFTLKRVRKKGKGD